MRAVRIGIVLLALCLTGAVRADSPTVIQVDVSRPGHPFPHFWERMFGSGRAILSLRDSYRRDLREVKARTGFEYVRFHAIFHDEVGVYDEDAQGRPVYNFSYVDQIYDGLLQEQVRPFVELSFMPRKLSASPAVQHPFWYHPLSSPPRDYDRWGELIAQFARHLVDRYGMDEVSQWYFEVWNEPNIDFWSGDPKESTYYRLYDATARALKGVSPRLRVGGPATAQAAWVDRFIQHCVEGHVPVDFASTHVYANDTAADVLGTHETISRRDMVARAVRKVHDQVRASGLPHLPIFFSEYNASYMNERDVTDAPFMGPWLADTIRQCDGQVDVMAYWAFSDVFEEQGVVKTPFYGGFGLMAAGGIPKASANAFSMLHRLGTTRIPVDSPDALLTRRADGTYAMALWNYEAPEAAGSSRTFTLQFHGNPKAARVQRLDAQHGSALTAWLQMGSPDFPTREQQAALRAAARVPPQPVPVTSGTLTVSLPPHGMVLLEFNASRQ